MALFLAALLLTAQPPAQPLLHAAPAAPQTTPNTSPAAPSQTTAPTAPSQTTAPAEPPQTGVPAGKVERPDDLLALPKGKSTVMGGIITRVDPVTDTLLLHVYGGKRFRIFFDERTQVYRDGEKTSLATLHVNERAAVETMLDGDDVFARSIRMLTQTPQGQFQGQIIGYDPGRNTLTVNEPLSKQPIKLTVPAGTPIERKGQAASAGAGSPQDLVKGALIAAIFRPDNSGQGVVQQISILAVPGDVLNFDGPVTYVNLRRHEFAITDSRNSQNYTIRFDPGAFPAAGDIRDGARVRVSATFDGDVYQARSIELLH